MNTKDLHPGVGSGALRERLCERITSYLTLGGLFNAELANHDAVRELLSDCRVGLSLSSPIEPVRCKITGNPCGTDTWVTGCPCNCKNCSKWLRARPTPQASSEVREAGEELAQAFALFEGTLGKNWMNTARAQALVALDRWRALAPSRQGAAKRVEG